jgi:branched-chain amino acid aminotransferase
MAYKETEGASWTWFEGKWHSGNPMIMGPMTHAPWLGSCVFDGARAFEGATPDLDRHCQRIVRSAESFGLKIIKTAEEIEELTRDGIAKFPNGAALYLRPMFWAESGFVDVDPESTKFSVSVYDSPLPEPKGFSITLSPFRRPSFEYAPTDAKAACHYPNAARAIREASSRGFDNAVMLDPLGHVSELATANLWMVKDGEAHTPVPNGTFLNGITRQRTIALLRRAGITVHERSILWRDFLDADELFSTGNYGKVQPVTRIEDRHLQPGPVYKKARELYWSFAHEGPSAFR